MGRCAIGTNYTMPLLSKAQSLFGELLPCDLLTQEFAAWHHQTLTQASVLEVLTLEAYATMGKVRST